MSIPKVAVEREEPTRGLSGGQSCGGGGGRGSEEDIWRLVESG